jgi:Flp pilus assembly protein TadB
VGTRQQRVDNGLKDRSLGELLKLLSKESATLVRQEIELAKSLVSEEIEVAKQELAQKAKQAGAGAGLFGAAAVIGLAAVGAFTAFVILLLSLLLPAWAAAVIVAVVFAAVAALLARKGRDKVQQAAPVVPEQTVSKIKEDVTWFKTDNPSART